MGWVTSEQAKQLEDEALSLLQEIVTKARNGMPYKHLLPRLKELMPLVPWLPRVCGEIVKEK